MAGFENRGFQGFFSRTFQINVFAAFLSAIEFRHPMGWLDLTCQHGGGQLLWIIKLALRGSD
jgi:hypothetical protein